MSIEIDSLWTDGDNIIMVKRIDYIAALKVVIYEEIGVKHILTERDFLEQYKPYEVVYEYRWVVGEVCSERVTKHYTDEEAEKELSCYLSNRQRIEYTKRERKCQK